ncbi:sigma factor G inhibitor Gin [Bacillus songklensis]|uniref:Sigma factor G inhibitor Gin n=1 Tax=Bacillus songklensis TaxID=1069116 RepID=A0ABV8AVP7_9BACI
MNQYPFTYSKGPCIICDESKEDGVRINHHFICAHCEKEMIHLPISANSYSYFVQKLKKLSC